MYEIRTLSNGLQVIMEKVPFVRSVAFGIWVLNGSRNENDETNGMSHFIEHMLFKGTKTRSAKDIANQMDAVGGQLNAYTSKDYTCYYTRALDEHMDIALEVMSDMLINSLFNQEEIDKELNVILEEIDMYEDSPDELVNDILQEAVWKDMPLGKPILGTQETISSFLHNDFVKYYKDNYTVHNTVLSISGSFETEEMLEMLEKYFGVWRNTSKNQSVVTKSIYTPSIIVRQKDIEQVHISLGFRGIDTASKDLYSVNVLNTIFGDGMSSRLFQKIREERGLAYTVCSDTYNYLDDGLLTVYAGLAASQLEEVMDIIKKEIEIIKKDYTIKEDVKKVKEQLKSNFIISLESTNNRMFSLGRSKILTSNIKTSQEIILEIEKITVEDILRMANQILDIKQMSISVVGNIDESDVRKII